MSPSESNRQSLVHSNRQLFIRELDQLMTDIDLLPGGGRPHQVRAWIDETNAINLELRFLGQRLDLENGDHTLSAVTFDDLVEQLDQIKIIAAFGGFDDALARCAAVVESSS
ncbi:hypothetical protein AB7714_19895 [Tardiphaga sp. 1201_B9_N1_1]|uniref:hypothetical protein n=1 Tax=unclassified Tardiphaga TaxID=2631404 RepID=UPI003F246F26